MFVRPNAHGGCRLVVARNSLSNLAAQPRELTYKTCQALVAVLPPRLWDIAAECSTAVVSASCPPVSAGFPCDSDAGDEEARTCGLDPPLPLLTAIDVTDFLVSSPGPVLEPGYLEAWKALPVAPDPR